MDRVGGVEGRTSRRDTEVGSGKSIADVIAGKLSSVKGREVDPAANGGRAADRGQSRAADPDVANAAALAGRHSGIAAGGVGRDVCELERIVATAFKEGGIVRGLPQFEVRPGPH